MYVSKQEGSDGDGPTETPGDPQDKQVGPEDAEISQIIRRV